MQDRFENSLSSVHYTWYKIAFTWPNTTEERGQNIASACFCDRTILTQKPPISS